MQSHLRIYMTGVGGQGTLTATTLLARVALDQGLQVVAGEVHGMAQRGGVVESVVLLGGWLSPKLGHGEADVIMGFEPLETLRALPYLAPNGKIFSSTDPLAPVSVNLGNETYPTIDDAKKAIYAKCSDTVFIPCRSLGLKAGSIQAGNTTLLGAICAAKILPFGSEAIEEGIKKYFAPKIVDANIKALHLGMDKANAD